MRRIFRWLFGFAIGAAFGCSGEISAPGGFTLPGAGAAPTDRAATPDTGSGRWQRIDRASAARPDAPSSPGGAANGSGGAPGSDDPSWQPGFGIDHSQPALLPLDMRLRRLADALGVSVDDPLLDGGRDARIALGGYDHAQGVLPDGLWMASRVASWVRVLRPICGSDAMRTRYPALPDALPSLIRAAWGRSAQPEDLADFEAELAASGLDAAARYEAICLAVFSAAEFVYQ